MHTCISCVSWWMGVVSLCCSHTYEALPLKAMARGMMRKIAGKCRWFTDAARACKREFPGGGGNTVGVAGGFAGGGEVGEGVRGGGVYDEFQKLVFVLDNLIVSQVYLTYRIYEVVARDEYMLVGVTASRKW